MLQGLLLLFIGILVFITIVVVAFFHLIGRVLNALRHPKWRNRYAEEADSTARRSTQYSHNSGRKASDTSSSTIIDTRDPKHASRKIISDDEGEYVDFQEE